MGYSSPNLIEQKTWIKTSVYICKVWEQLTQSRTVVIKLDISKMEVLSLFKGHLERKEGKLSRSCGDWLDLNCGGFSTRDRCRRPAGSQAPVNLY